MIRSHFIEIEYTGYFGISLMADYLNYYWIEK